MHFYLAHCKKVKLEKRPWESCRWYYFVSPCTFMRNSTRDASDSFDSALPNVSMLHRKRKLDFKEVTRLERDRAALFLDKQSSDRLRGFLSFGSSLVLCPGIPIVWWCRHKYSFLPLDIFIFSYLLSWNIKRVLLLSRQSPAADFFFITF